MTARLLILRQCYTGINAKQHREAILPVSWSLFSKAICDMSGRQFDEGAANIPRI
jgi:hypothetical protein